MLPTTSRSIVATSLKLLLVVPLMFAFVFVVMVPLYDAFCEWTGLNGKTGGQYTADPAGLVVDESRTIEVRFVATNSQGMEWEFHPQQALVRVHPGAENDTLFFARNPSGGTMVGRAIPSIVPSSAAAYFHKTECFCFNEQKLTAGEAVEMPMRFIVDRDLPRAIRTITLSYMLFDVTESAQKPAVAMLN